MKRLYTKEDLPYNTMELINKGKVTYRGCDFGYDDVKIKVDKKEYKISCELFNEFGGINKMRFSAPYRTEK